MALRTVNHSCGHSEAYQFYGANSERDRKQEWMSKQPCQECKRQAEQAAVQSQLTKSEIAISKPELTGSEKQIAWGKDLRDRFLAEALKQIASANLTEEQAAQATAFTQEMINAKTESKYWIDNRFENVNTMLSDYQKSK